MEIQGFHPDSPQSTKRPSRSLRHRRAIPSTGMVATVLDGVDQEDLDEHMLTDQAMCEEHQAAITGAHPRPMSGTDQDFSPSDRQPLLPQVIPSQINEAIGRSAGSKVNRFTLLTLTIVFCQIFCEVAKQVSNYSVQYYNHGKYPIPQTSIVILMELTKLIATIIRAKGSIPKMSASSWRSSMRFLLPSVLYAVNNNIYFIGLTLVPPPIWLILCSIRTAITASIYKFVLKRSLTFWQFVGAMLIVMSIVIAKAPDILGKPDAINTIPMLALFLALAASCNSVCAAIYTESLFKSNAGPVGETFLDQQFWLYFYGMLVATAVHVVPNPHYQVLNLIKDIRAMSDLIYGFFWMALFFGSIGGLVVASILKLLDNIVKEYSGSVANVLTAIVCAHLFPDKFELNKFIMISLSCLLVGIYLYENMKATPVPVKASTPGNENDAKSAPAAIEVTRKPPFAQG